LSLKGADGFLLTLVSTILIRVPWHRVPSWWGRAAGGLGCLVRVVIDSKSPLWKRFWSVEGKPCSRPPGLSRRCPRCYERQISSEKNGEKIRET
jgi:hypothetical protein